MISLAYIHGNQDVELEDIKSLITESFFDATESIMNELDEAYREYCESSKLIEAELFVMEAVDDNKKEKLQNNKAGFIEKIGQTIINLFNKFMEMANNIINNLKGKISGDTRKIEYLCKKDPSIAEKIKGMAQRGEITLRDAKDFKDLDKLYEDIMKSNEDPNTLKARWKKGCEKLEERKGLIFGVAAAAIAVSSIVKFGPDIMKANKDLRETSRENNDAFNKAYASFKADWEKENPNKDFTKENGIFQAKLAIHRDMLGKKAAAMQKNQSAFQKLASMAASTADKVTDKVNKNAKSNFHSQHSYDATKVKEAEDKKKQDEIDEKNRQADYNQELRNKADIAKEKRMRKQKVRDDREKKRDALEKEIRDDLRKRAAEDRAEKKKLKAEDRQMNNAEDLAYKQQKGRNKANNEDNKPRGPQHVIVHQGD